MFERLNQIANNIINYSCNVTMNDTVYLYCYGEYESLLNVLIEKINHIGAKYIVKYESNNILKKRLETLSNDNINKWLENDSKELSQATVYISLLAEEVEVPERLHKEYLVYQREYKQTLRDIRLKNCRWIGLKLPTREMASKTNLSFEEFQKLYFVVCGQDYSRMEDEYKSLANAIRQAKEIQIIADETDISFTKEDIPVITLAGKINLPDGEIYTAPNKYSVNGKVKINTSSYQAGEKYEDIKLWFKNGKVIKALSSTGKIDKVLDIDEGARYIGEFAIGINKAITSPIGLILFDEKIYGSVHFALGQSYENAYNYNDSSLHWDLVLDLNKSAGGGQIFFDGKEVFRDGKWQITVAT